MASRPLVFIGSSAEGLPLAKGIQQGLEYAAECVIWHQGVFGLSEGTLDSLVNTLDKYDFAILVLTPDDLIVSRAEEQKCPRDNVLLELGMFIGGLGRERTFIVVDRTAKIKLPSDLAGVTTASFAPPEAGTIQSAVGPACTSIENAIKERGKRRDDFPIDITTSSFIGRSGKKGISLKITNRGNVELPPFNVGIQHDMLGSFFMFPTEKEGVLHPNQNREFACVLFSNGSLVSHLPNFDIGNEVVDHGDYQVMSPDARELTQEEKTAFKFRLVLEDSDDHVLFESNDLGNALVNVIQKTQVNGSNVGGNHEDWSRLSYRTKNS